MRTIKFFPFLLVAYEICNYLSNDMYLPALPQMSIDFKTSHEFSQATLTYWFVGAASMQLLLGPIADRFGRRPVLLTGGIIFTLMCIICTYTSNTTTMLIARYLQGCATCSMVIAGYTTIHELYNHLTAIKVLALMGGITVLAPAFGPLLGSIVLTFSTWRGIFAFLAIFAFFTLYLLYKHMPETQSLEQRRSTQITKIFSQYGAILVNKKFMLNVLAYCSLFIGLIAWLSAGPFLVTQTFKYSDFIFSLAQMQIFGGFIIGTRCVNFLLDNRGVYSLVQLGLGIALCGALLTVLFATLLPTQFYLFVCAFTIFGFGCALSLGPLQRLAIESAQESMGARMAILSSVLCWCGILGSLAASVFYDGSTAMLSYIVLGSMIFGFSCYWYLTISAKSVHPASAE